MSTRAFTSDVAQLIKLVTHSVYSNQEVFLRELVSNASDALAKVKLKSLQEPDYLGDHTDLRISIDVDTEAKTLTISDTGIGMTQDQVIDHIGTIAKSGTKERLTQIQEAQKNAEHGLIGQFGIGFYSAFMVADRVVLETKSNESPEATYRESTGEGSYEIKKSKKTTRGTSITLYLNEASHEFAQEYRIRSLIKQHSNYVIYPIMMKEAEDTSEDKEDKSKTKEYQQINDGIALWNKAKSQVNAEQLKEFYQSLSYDMNDPLDHIHLNIEGVINYKALLFLPKGPDMSAMMRGGSDQEYGPKLYVQNILIMEQCKELLPVRLRRVKGVVETSDLSLNVSREILQASPIMTKIQSSLIKEVLKSLEYAKKEKPDAYAERLTNYGKILKEGIHYDQSNREQIASLITWNHTATDTMISLDEYIEQQAAVRSRDGSKTLLYLTGRSVNDVQHSPYLKPFVDQGMDILLMTDPIDEWAVAALPMYKDWKFVAITSDEAKKLLHTTASQDKQDEIATKEKENKDFLSRVVTAVGSDKIEAVRLTHSLGDTIGLLVTKDGDINPQMQQYLKAMGQTIPTQKRIMELNADHPLVQRMMSLYQGDAHDPKLVDLVSYTYDQAILNEGGQIDNIHAFIQRVNGLIG